MEKNVSKSVLKRLPGYLAYLKSIQEPETPYISATALAAALGMEPADLHGGTDPQAGVGGGANGQEKPGEEERAFRTTVVALGLVVVFALLLLFGYMVGRDMAAKDNRQACIAEGRTDCR